MRGTVARDTIGGSSADGDTVISGQGNDYLLSGPGADVFAFDPGDGQDWIDNFAIGVDKLQFGGGLTAANLSYTNLTVEGVPGLAVVYGGGANFVFLARATAASLPPPPTWSSLPSRPGRAPLSMMRSRRRSPASTTRCSTGAPIPTDWSSGTVPCTTAYRCARSRICS